MSWISVDIEADGPAPSLFSMIAIGAVLVGDHSKTFHGLLAPITWDYQPDALAVSGFSREDTEQFPPAEITMWEFYDWILREAEKPYIFVADNNGFDWQFVNYYFHRYCANNPFGFSSKNINSLFHGITKNTKASFKHLRKTPHDHNPVNDAKGNAEALIHMRDKMELKVKF